MPVALLLVSGALVGCDGGENAMLRLERLSNELEHVTSAIESEERVRMYTRLESEFRGLSQEDGSIGAAATLHLALVHAGLAQIELERGHVLSAQVLSGQSEEGTGALGAAQLRSRFEAYVRVRSRELGLQRQDLSAQFEQLDAEARELSEQINVYGGRLSALNERIASLETERQRRSDSVVRLRERAFGALEGVEGASATARQPVLEEARELTRRADALEVEAGEFDITIAQEILAAASLESEIRLLTQRRGLNEQARERTRQSERKLREDRELAGDEADEIATALLSGYEALVAAYEQGARERFEAATDGLSQAAGEAGRAQQEIQSARDTRASIRLLEATAWLARSSAESMLADLGRDLGSMLEREEALRSRVETLEASARRAMSEAADAYGDAEGVLDDAARSRAEAIRAALGEGDASTP